MSEEKDINFIGCTESQEIPGRCVYVSESPHPLVMTPQPISREYALDLNEGSEKINEQLKEFCEFQEIKKNGLILNAEETKVLRDILDETDRDKNGRTALQNAVLDNDENTVKVLCKIGVDLNFRGSEWFPPLISAVLDKEIGIARILLESGADPNVETENGKTAMRFIKTDEMSELLRKYGAKE